MAIGSVNYPTPVTVNGFRCANCAEVDQAKAHIDPAHPRSGADDVDALTDPTRSQDDKARLEARRKAAAAAEIPAYRANGSHASGSSILGLSVDRTA